MKLEEISVFGRPKDRYLCSVKLIISDGDVVFGVRGFRVLDLGHDEPYLAMPTRRKETVNGPLFEELFYPISQSAKRMIQEAVMREYDAFTNRR